jgi:hypothetical protein
VKKRRETRSEFWGRMTAEGRVQEAAARQKELAASGLGGREAYLQTFAEFTPLDGTEVIPREPGAAGKGCPRPREEPGKKGRLSHRKVLEWVWEHMADPKPPRAPNGKAQALLEFAKGDPNAFLEKYVPLLVRGSKELQEGADGKNPYTGDCRKHLEELEQRTKVRDLHVGMSVAPIKEQLGEPGSTEEVPLGERYEKEFKVPLDPAARYRVLRFLPYPSEDNGSDVGLYRLNILVRDDVVVGFRQYSHPAVCYWRSLVSPSEPLWYRGHPRVPQTFEETYEENGRGPLSGCPACRKPPPGDPDCPRCNPLAKLPPDSGRAAASTR